MKVASQPTIASNFWILLSVGHNLQRITAQFYYQIRDAFVGNMFYERAEGPNIQVSTETADRQAGPTSLDLQTSDQEGTTTQPFLNG